MAKRKLKISEKELEEIRARKRTEGNNKIYRRLMFLEMKGGGLQNKEIVKYLDVRIETLSAWTNLYLGGGLETLCNLQYEGRRISPLDSIKEEIKNHIEKENVSTLKALKYWLEKEHELSFGIAWIQRFLKKNSIFLIKKQD